VLAQNKLPEYPMHLLREKKMSFIENVTTLNSTSLNTISLNQFRLIECKINNKYV